MNNKKNMHVVFFAPTTPYYFKRWEYYQVEYQMLKNTCSRVTVCHSFVKLIKIILSNKVDLIFCFWWHTSAPVVLLSILFNKKTYITGSVHMYDESGSEDFFKKSLLFRVACRISWRLAYRSLFVSKSQFRQITSHERVNNPIVLKSPLHPDYNIDIAKENLFKKKDSKIRFLTIVWMTQEQLNRKGVYQVLGALKLLVDSNQNNFEWIIAGGIGDGSSQLQNTINEMHMENYVDIKHDISNQEKNYLYSSCDLFLQPSFYEGFGNAVLEAMSYGTPALVSGYASQPEVVKESGIIVNELNSENIAEKLRVFLNSSNYDFSKMRKKVIEVVHENHLFSYREKLFNEILEKDFKR